MQIKFTVIGHLITPFKIPEQMPVQPCSKLALSGYAVIEDDYVAGLKDLDSFSHLILIYHFHRQTKTELLVRPFLDKTARGVFATRAPARPNAIGLSVVKLIRIEENKLFFDKLDMLSGTPLLDIKPFVPGFDIPESPTSGWLSNIKDLSDGSSDGRFV